MREPSGQGGIGLLLQGGRGEASRTTDTVELDRTQGKPLDKGRAILDETRGRGGEGRGGRGRGRGRGREGREIIKFCTHTIIHIHTFPFLIQQPESAFHVRC